jgi:hypothetical protein
MHYLNKFQKNNSYNYFFIYYDNKFLELFDWEDIFSLKGF